MQQLLKLNLILKQSVAIEIEIVPFKVAELISNNIDVFMIGMGSGLGCDDQYLFADDILGSAIPTNISNAVITFFAR